MRPDEQPWERRLRRSAIVLLAGGPALAVILAFADLNDPTGSYHEIPSGRSTDYLVAGEYTIMTSSDPRTAPPRVHVRGAEGRPAVQPLEEPIPYDGAWLVAMLEVPETDDYTFDTVPNGGDVSLVVGSPQQLEGEDTEWIPVFAFLVGPTALGGALYIALWVARRRTQAGPAK